jgi:hypothetical protein
MASFQVSGFTRPGIYVFELQVRSGPVLSPNVATVNVYAPGLAGNVHASPSDGQFGLPLATVSAYTNYAQAVNAQLTWVDSKQTLDRPPEAVGDFALDGLGTGTYWVVAHGQGYQRYGPARVRVNYGSATRSMAVNLASLEYRFQGRVTDSATGQGLENVQVVLSTGVETELFRTTTDAQGRYALHAVPGGSHPVMFLREGYNAVTHNVTITQDMTKDYTLSRNVSGQLAALAGTITAQFRGLALAVPGAEVILVGGLVRAHTDAAGDYRIDNLPPGNYYGTIRKAGYRPGKLSDLGAGLVTLEAGRTTVADRALLFAETGPVIRGVVVGADGGAVGGASVTVLQAAPKAGAPTKGRTAVLLEAEPVPSDAAGVFQLAGVPEGERLVRVTLPDGTAFTNAINVTGSMEMVATGSQASRIPWDWKERRYGTNAVPAGWDGTDEDRDGRTAWDEYVLDSAPGVSNAPFTARMTLGGGQWQFALDGTSMDRLYDVWWSTNLLRTNWWHSFLGGRRGTGGQLVLSVTNHPRRSHCFYRPAASAP